MNKTITDTIAYKLWKKYILEECMNIIKPKQPITTELRLNGDYRD